MRTPSPQPATQPAAPADPAQGGRYVRNTNGTLTCIHETAPAVSRAAASQAGTQPASSAAPSTDTPEE